MKSFVDLLFILLCSTIVMLSRSVEVGAVEINPAKVGSGGVSEVRADDVRIVSVKQFTVTLSDDADGVIEFEDIAKAAAAAGTDKCILLSAATEGVTHHRIMQVWSDLIKAGQKVKLAAVETETRSASAGIKPQP
jgi:hypothetical protein